MKRQVHQMIIEVADRRHVDPALIVAKCRSEKVFRARAEVAKLLHAHGYSSCRIGRMLNHDHSTILYYLGHAKKRPKPEIDPRPRWRRPRVRHLAWLAKPRRPKKPELYLVPYAGADMIDYQWKERADAPVKTHSR